MDKKNLSKIKYIYRIYSADDMLHLERHPVVYINSEFVYFKWNRKNDLGRKSFYNVLDRYKTITRASYYSSAYVTHVEEYFWGIETDIQSIYDDLKKQYENFKKERMEYLRIGNKEEKRARLERAKREYEAALKEYEALESTEE